MGREQDCTGDNETKRERTGFHGNNGISRDIMG